jgi:hypothetical protein
MDCTGVLVRRAGSGRRSPVNLLVVLPKTGFLDSGFPPKMKAMRAAEDRCSASGFQGDALGGNDLRVRYDSRRIPGYKK